MTASPATPAVSLTDPAFIRRLDSLALLARRILGGKLQASRRTIQKGAGITFSDYAEYTLGDDYRAIDWRVFGRLEQLVIKLFEMEQDMTLLLMLDCSASMRAKHPHALRLTAALAYLALAGLDRVTILSFDNTLRTVGTPFHGRGRSLSMLRTLEGITRSDGASDFDGACTALAQRYRRKAMVVPVSDFFFPGGFEAGLGRLRHARHEVFALQVQDDGDRATELHGDVELECVEGGGRRSVTIGPAERRRYAEAVKRWNAKIAATCARRGIGLASVTTDVPVDDIISRILRAGGLVG